jgi:hypothetical protein
MMDHHLLRMHLYLLLSLYSVDLVLYSIANVFLQWVAALRPSPSVYDQRHYPSILVDERLPC